MALPNTRAEFKEHIKRRLGHPMIEINVTEEQIDDRVDEALSYYADCHFDGSIKQYYRYQITADDITNKYITLPDNIIGAVKVFNYNFIGSYSNDMFNVKYQIAMNDLYHLNSFSLVPYYMTMEQLGLIENVLVGEIPIRFNRRMHRLYIDTNWTEFKEDHWIVIEAHQVVEPGTFSDVWHDRWLIEYATEKLKQQWGTNLSKFAGIPLPGGMMFNGEKLYNDATAKIEKLEEEMITTYSIPLPFIA